MTAALRLAFTVSPLYSQDLCDVLVSTPTLVLPRAGCVMLPTLRCVPLSSIILGFLSAKKQGLARAPC